MALAVGATDTPLFEGIPRETMSQSTPTPYRAHLSFHFAKGNRLGGVAEGDGFTAYLDHFFSNPL